MYDYFSCDLIPFERRFCGAWLDNHSIWLDCYANYSSLLYHCKQQNIADVVFSLDAKINEFKYANNDTPTFIVKRAIALGDRSKHRSIIAPMQRYSHV